MQRENYHEKALVLTVLAAASLLTAVAMAQDKASAASASTMPVIVDAME